MPAERLVRKLAAIRRAMAQAEETGSADLIEVAAEIGVKAAQLASWIDSIVAVERRVAAEGWEPPTEPGLRRDGMTLTVGRNLLRDLETEPPDIDTAVRLFVQARQFQGMDPDATNLPLARAITKLERIVGQKYPIVVREAPYYVEVEESIAPTRCRVLRITYVNDGLTDSEREVEPVAVFAADGFWYLEAFDRLTDEVRVFRVDRIHALSKTSETVVPRERSHPGRFDLSDVEHRLTVRVRTSLLDAFRAFDVRVEAERSRGDGTVEADLVVFGDRRLDQLLLSLGPDGAVIAPTTYRARRAERATALLARYR